jgi:hypothetical protein
MESIMTEFEVTVGVAKPEYGRPNATCIRLMAHSAVETEDGTLCDITPHEASTDYPFIRHLGTDEEFELFGRVEYFDLPV